MLIAAEPQQKTVEIAGIQPVDLIKFGLVLHRSHLLCLLDESEKPFVTKNRKKFLENFRCEDSELLLWYHIDTGRERPGNKKQKGVHEK